MSSYHHPLPSVTLAHERIFAQFADRSQTDLTAQGLVLIARRHRGHDAFRLQWVPMTS
jgi:hypothetical protein